MHVRSLAPVESRDRIPTRTSTVLIPLTLLIAFALTLMLKLSAPGMVLTIQPLPSISIQENTIWVMDSISERAPTTDWNNVTLGTGWIKGNGPPLPSGAAALTSWDRSEIALVVLCKLALWGVLLGAVLTQTRWRLVSIVTASWQAVLLSRVALPSFLCV